MWDITKNILVGIWFLSFASAILGFLMFHIFRNEDGSRDFFSPAIIYWLERYFGEDTSRYDKKTLSKGAKLGTTMCFMGFVTCVIVTCVILFVEEILLS